MSATARLLNDHARHAAAAALAVGIAMSAAGGGWGIVASAVALPCLLATGARAWLALVVSASILAGSAFGAARLAAIDRDPLGELGAARSWSIRGVVVEHPRPVASGGARMRARVYVPGSTRTQLVEVRTRRAPNAEVPIGSLFLARGRLSPVDPSAARTQSGIAYARYLRRNGVRRRFDTDAITLTGAMRGGVAGVVDSIRLRSERTLAVGLAREPEALLRGMVLGGDAGIPERTVEDFRVAGLSHILAVSGQNVLLLVTLVQAVATATGLGRMARLVIPVALICVYVPLCGVQASVVRAGAMGLAALVATMASRPASRVYALLLGAIAVLASNPRATADIGAQLSFAAVLGIAAFAGPISRRLRRWPQWMAEAFAVTAGATVATAPLMAFHFGAVSLVSIVANVVAAPLIGPIVWLGSLAAAIGQVAPAAGALLNAPNEFLLGSLISVAHAAAGVPGAQLVLTGFGGGALATVFALMLIVAAVANHERSRSLVLGLRRALPESERQSGGSGRPVAGPFGVWLVVTAAIVAVALVPWPGVGGREPALPRPSIVMLDVGQGDATLVLGRDGCSALIDGGPPGHGLPRRLRRLGIDRLDLVVATHAQLDHDGGLGDIARARAPRVAAFLDGGGTVADPRFAALRRSLTEAGSIAAPAIEGRRWRCGDLRVDVLGPRALKPGAAPPADPNERAAVTHVRVSGMSMLAAGDAEGPQLLPLALPHAEVLKVSHHGSGDPALAALLARVRPVVGLIGVGRENRYGHPTAETLTELAKAGVDVFRTDRDGTVAVEPGLGAGSARVITRVEQR